MHEGSTLASKSNHYIAYVNHKDVGWYKYNDASVVHKSEKQALEAAKQGYYFVY